MKAKRIQINAGYADTGRHDDEGITVRSFNEYRDKTRRTHATIKLPWNKAIWLARGILRRASEHADELDRRANAIRNNAEKLRREVRP